MTDEERVALNYVAAPPDTPYFEIDVVEDVFEFVRIPKQFQKCFPKPRERWPIQEQWFVFHGLAAPDWNKVRPVEAQVYNHNGKLRYGIGGGGWASYVSWHDLRVGDVLRIYVLPDRHQFRIRWFRNGNEKTGSPWVPEDASTPETESNDSDDGFFKVHFTQSYIDMNRMNIPLSVAHKYFEGLGKVTPVDLILGNVKWEAELHITRRGGKIISSCVKHGVDRFYDDNNIKDDQWMLGEWDGDSDPRVIRLEWLAE